MPISLTSSDTPEATIGPTFDRIAKRIGSTLRDLYGPPEHQPLPIEHVELLLRLRHKERDASRPGIGPD